MKVLYIIKRDLDTTAEKLIENQKLNNEITVVNLYEKSAEELLDLIETHDKLIMW
ncbi:MAG: hypothetical protein HY756_01005 [Nitrospirae bacterium]|nr:hypothetical protein [Nitrospirota bacterium]